MDGAHAQHSSLPRQLALLCSAFANCGLGMEWIGTHGLSNGLVCILLCFALPIGVVWILPCLD
jgi:hypothetical protein